MKELAFIFLFFQLNFAKAQRVSWVKMSQEGKNVVVEYVLEANAPQEILLYLSQDGGKTFSRPLEKVSGLKFFMLTFFNNIVQLISS